MSFFSAISKHRSFGVTNTREDRLTEILAAVLQEVNPELAVQLATFWLDDREINPNLGEKSGSHRPRSVLDGPGPKEFLTPRTQRPLTDRFVDLELEFDCSSAPVGQGSRLIRVEAKLGTAPKNGQVRAYEQRDRDGNPTIPVVILAPARDLPFEDPWEAPVTAPQRSWESTFRFLRGFATTNDLNEKEEWLLEELQEFMREEGLSPIMEMEEKHANALAISRQVETVLQALIAGARRQIAIEWGGDSERPSGGGRGQGSWKHYPYGPDSGDSLSLPKGTWLEFKTTSGRLSLSDGPEDEVAFIAGLSWNPRETPSLSDSLRANLLSKEFFEFKEGGKSRLMRIRTPSDLLGAATTIEAQGRALGDWVVETFQIIDLSLSSGLNRIDHSPTGLD